jgi:hypothetical protein
MLRTWHVTSSTEHFKEKVWLVCKHKNVFFCACENMSSITVSRLPQKILWQFSLMSKITTTVINYDEDMRCGGLNPVILHFWVLENSNKITFNKKIIFRFFESHKHVIKNQLTWGRIFGYVRKIVVHSS